MLSTDSGICVVSYDCGASERIRVMTVSHLLGSADTPSSKSISPTVIDEKCREYWQEVNDAVEDGTLSRDFRAFLAKLMTLGDEMRGMLMDKKTSSALWTLAHNSATIVLVIPDRLLHVPWEALFNADDKFRSFLADRTVIARYPENPDAETAVAGMDRKSFIKERIVCVDRILRESLENQFRSDGEEVCFPGNQLELSDNVRDTRLTHWICEHKERKGLRFDDRTFFTARDSSAHRFTSGSVLMLTSCRSGAHAPDAPSIAARICCFSDCTVIAPSSLIAVNTGVQFVRAINTAINQAAKPLSVADFWRTLGDQRASNVANPTLAPSTEAWSALWYGIYGDVNRRVRG